MTFAPKPAHLLFFLCLSLWVVLALRTGTDYDIGFHLAAGRWIAQNHAFPRTDAFTYGAQGRPYVDVQWLYQTIQYGLARLWGFKALTILNCFLATILFFVLFERLGVHLAGDLEKAVYLTLLLLGIEHRFLLRPELLTWILLAVTLWIMDLYYWGKGDRLAFLPLLQVFWANVEGLFVVGWIAMAAYGAGVWVRDRRPDKHFLRWSALSAAATLLNPYFLQGALFPFSLSTRLEGSNIFKQTTGELASPWADLHAVYPGFPLFLALYKALFVLVPLIALLMFKRTRTHEWVLLAAFGHLSLAALRNTPLFLLVAVPLLGRLIGPWKFPWWLSFAGRVLLALFLSATLLRVVHNAYYVANDNRAEFGLGLSSTNLPLKAGQFLVDHGLKGRVVNSVGVGGWLEWLDYPVYIDGRLEVMGDGLYKEYLESLKPGAVVGLARKYDASIVVYDHRSMPLWTEQMILAGWRLVYFDENSAVYLAPDYRRDLPAADFESLPLEWGVEPFDPGEVDGLCQKPRVPWFRSIEEGLERPQRHYQDYLYLGDLAFHYRHYAVAEGLYLEGLHLAEGREYNLFVVLARDYIRTEQWQRAAWCLESALTFGRDTRKLEAQLASLPE
jgi:hypothetical protein